MFDLLDASVWVPLSAPDHVHHARARRYWESESSGKVAFCRVTALALLRHLTNPRIMGHAVQSGSEAWQAYESWLSLREIAMLAEPEGLDRHLKDLSHSLELGPALWTDSPRLLSRVASGLWPSTQTSTDFPASISSTSLPERPWRSATTNASAGR